MIVVIDVRELDQCNVFYFSTSQMISSHMLDARPGEPFEQKTHPWEWFAIDYIPDQPVVDIVYGMTCQHSGD